ncbi:DUF6252 family protein [Flavobacterium sp.]|uniref:DUF6252 family protein n=1 Tax=Flavobacterium sp. TaxID=239 RepID=UPI003C5ABBF0
MKKYFLFCVFLLCLNSCEENIKFNNPSFQGVKNNVFWRAVATTATVKTNGSLTIIAYTSNEEITLKTNATILKTYELGIDDINTITYSQTGTATKLNYATGTGKGDGQIIITEYDSTNKTISGTFRFNAPNTDADSPTEPILNFQEGVFYKIPVQL